MKALIVTILLLSLISCGGSLPHWDGAKTGDGGSEKTTPTEEIVEAVLPDLLDKAGCSMLYPQNFGDIIAVISCESGESYILYSDGSFEEGDISNIDLRETPVNEDEDEGDDIVVVDPIEDPVVEPVCSDSELIVNGSFEQGHGLGNNKWGLFDTLPGWYADLEKRNAAIEVQNGSNIGGIAASEGSAKVELDAHNKNGYTKSDVVLVQEFSAPSNKTFILSFDYSARIAANKKTNKARVFFNGKKVARLNSKKIGWKHFELTVTSASDLQKLEFRGKKDSDTVGGYIDNVSVRQICD